MKALTITPRARSYAAYASQVKMTVATVNTER